MTKLNVTTYPAMAWGKLLQGMGHLVTTMEKL